MFIWNCIKSKVLLIRMPTSFFMELNKSILKLLWKSNQARTARQIWGRNQPSWAIKCAINSLIKVVGTGA